MSIAAFTESVVEQAALAWLEGIGWRVTHGPDIAPDMPAAERADYGEVVLAQRLRDALVRQASLALGRRLTEPFNRPQATVSISRPLTLQLAGPMSYN